MDFGSLGDVAAAGPDTTGTSIAASSVPVEGEVVAGEFGGGGGGCLRGGVPALHLQTFIVLKIFCL